MFYFKILVQLTLFYCLITRNVLCYQIPKPTIQAFKGKGLKVSIPHEPGIKYFAFHGSLNEAIETANLGEFSGESRAAQNGKWLYDNPNLIVEVNDILNYWIFVQYDRLGYRLDGQSFTIKQLIDAAPTRPTQKPTTQKTTTQRPVTKSPTKATTTTTTITTTLKPPTTTETAPVECELSATTIKGQPTCKGQLIFEENFASINPAIWRSEVKFPLDTEDAEFVSYQNQKENLFIKNNNLWILPKLQIEYPGYDEDRLLAGDLNLNPHCTGEVKPSYECYRKAQRTTIIPPVVTAKISTKNSFSFLYGKIEIRARFPKGDWLFPELYLEPLENAYGVSNFASGQMRIGFIRANEMLDSKDNSQIDGYRLTGGVILSAAPKHRDTWMKGILHDRHLSEDYHVYSLTWTKSAISVSVNGMVYANYRALFKSQAISNNITHANDWNSDIGISPFDKEFYISLGVGAGGMGDFPDLSRSNNRHIKPWNNTSPKAEYNFWMDKNSWYPTWNGTSAMQVDYVKVWAL